MKKKSKAKIKRCACHCGGIVENGKRFIHGHHFRGKKHSKAVKEILSKKRLAYLRKEQDESEPHRLKFPSRKRSESLGDYRYRKFEYFCLRYVTHIAGKYAHKPVILMAWQKDILRKLLGTLDQNGKRVYKNLFIHVGRKNGKSFLVCLLILYFLAEESFNDPACELVSCAVTREQSSKVIFRTARLMVSYSKELSQLIKIGIVPPHLTNLLNNGTYEPLAADAAPQLGRNISLAIFDETHGQPNSELWDAITTSQSMREEPLLISISTAGDSRATFYYSLYEEMKKIEADPAVDPSTLVVIFETPEEVDWRDPASFLLANPAIGVKGEGFRPTDELELALKKAISGVGEQGYRQFYLNQFAKFGTRTLVPLDKWDLCGDDDIDWDLLKDRRVVGGLDWSETTDLTALSIIVEGPPEIREKWTVFVWCWLAGETLSECSRRDRLPYEKWVNSDEQWLFFEGKPTIDVQAVMDVLGSIQAQFPNLSTLGYDPYLSSAMAPIAEYLIMEPVPQQYAFLSPATKLLKVKILNQELKHDNNPLLRSMVENAKVLSDPSGNIRLDKSKSTSRIDGLVAVAIGFAIALKEWKERPR